MNGFNPSDKDIAAIAREWDLLAEMRADQLRQGKDLSFQYVLLPAVKELISDYDKTAILDVGCGVGALAAQLAPEAQRIVGVDASIECIRIAQADFGADRRLSFVWSTVEDFAHSDRREMF